MHPEQIKGAMRARGVSLSALAEELGVSVSTISQVVSGRSTSARIRSRVAQITGVPVGELWPATRLVNPLYRKAQA